MKNKAFTINQTGDVECRLDRDHTLIIHRSDEGIVLDVWRQGEREAVWGRYFFDGEMIDEYEEN
jgi:hypothetical protein